MKPNMLLSGFFLLSSILYAHSALSSSLENETSIAEFKSIDNNFTMRTSVYLQARMEYGDLIHGENAKITGSDFDVYFRKASIGFYGNAFFPKLKYGLTLSGDETPQDKVYPSYSEENGVALNGTYIAYQFSDWFTLRFGKEKLPYSRIYLVSSTRQAFSERPYYMFSWAEVLRTYAHTHVSVHGKGQNLSYSFSTGKAWREGDSLYDNASVTKSGPQFTLRAAWSPTGWQEEKISDSHLGQGRHFSLGVYGASQEALKYEFNDQEFNEHRYMYGIDSSFHIDNLNIQAEVNGWKVDTSEQARAKEALGWIFQTGYYIPILKAEPAIRYEEFDLNRDLNDADVRRLTLGVNTYFHNHNLKLASNIEYSKFGTHALLLKPDDDDKSFAVRITLQFIL